MEQKGGGGAQGKGGGGGNECDKRLLADSSPLSEPASSPLDGAGGGSGNRDPPWKVEQIEVTLSPPHPPEATKVAVQDKVVEAKVVEDAPAKASPDVVEVSEERRRQRERQWEGLAKEGLLPGAPSMANLRTRRLLLRLERAWTRLLCP